MATFTATLLENERLAPKTFVLHLSGCEPLVFARPGQFVMLRGEWGRDPLLPRAFSIMSVREGVAEILVKTVGRGTALLEAALPGAHFEVLGPLGSAFPAPSADRTDWLVAGGVGLAPLLFQLEVAAGAGAVVQTRLFYGGRSALDLVLLPRLAALGVTIHLATDDGSVGLRGRVTQLFEGRLAGPAGPPPTVLACGPDPMLVALARLVRAARLKAYLSLEGEMACGIGVCLGCAVPCASKPFRYTCTDGPVLDLDDLRGPYSPAPEPGASQR